MSMQIFPLEGVNMDMLNFEGLSFPLPAHNIGGEFFNKMSAFNATITDFLAESLNIFAAPQANGDNLAMNFTTEIQAKPPNLLSESNMSPKTQRH
jgi:hypothetical protein